MEANDTGFLLNPNNIKLHRIWFKQMCDAIGIKVLHRAPRADKHYNGSGELDSFYFEPEVVGCIFDEHPTIWTCRKLGWNSELQEDASIIHIPYDTKGIQVGSLFIVPSGIDHSVGRLFRVVRMSTISVYPASIACEIAPMWQSDFEKSQLDHKYSDFSLLADEEE